MILCGFVLLDSTGIINSFSEKNAAGNSGTDYSIYCKNSNLNMNYSIFNLPLYNDGNSFITGYLENSANLVTNEIFISKDDWTLNTTDYTIYNDITGFKLGDKYQILCDIKQGDQPSDINASLWLSVEGYFPDGTMASLIPDRDRILDTKWSVQSYTLTITEEAASCTKIRIFLVCTRGQLWYRRNWRIYKLPRRFLLS